MGAIASQITSLTIVCSIVYSDADQRKHQSSASLAFVRGIHRSPVNSPHKWPVTRKCFHLMTSSWINPYTTIHRFWYRNRILSAEKYRLGDILLTKVFFRYIMSKFLFSIDCKSHCIPTEPGDYVHHFFMMTSSNQNIFRVTGPLWGKSIGHRWIPLTKASDAELWCFLWSAPE